MVSISCELPVGRLTIFAYTAPRVRVQDICQTSADTAATGGPKYDIIQSSNTWYM